MQNNNAQPRQDVSEFKIKLEPQFVVKLLGINLMSSDLLNDLREHKHAKCSKLV